ncbi:hypothetical protein GCM10027203_38310 [Nonomuraea fastidiosa]
MSTSAFDTAITQARDLLRWRSPLRTELWAARLTAELEGSGQVEEFLRRATEDGGMEARLALAALAAVNRPATAPGVTPAPAPGETPLPAPGETPAPAAGETPAPAPGEDSALAPGADSASGPGEHSAPGSVVGDEGGAASLSGGASGDSPPSEGATEGPAAPGETAEGTGAAGGGHDEATPGSADERPAEADGGAEGARAAGSVYAAAGDGVLDSLAGWVRRMGRVRCDGGWYGKADPYGEQVLAVLSFRYENGKEPHILVVGIDQPSGGLAVDALVEEAKFLDELDLRPTPPESVAKRVLDAFELTDRVMGARVADTLPGVRPFAITRARTVLARTSHDTGPAGSQQEPSAEARLEGLDVSGPGVREAFDVLMEFVGERTLWWSPARVSQFLTQWLPREAILSEAAIEAMPEVVRAWTMRQGGHPDVLRQIDRDAPRLPGLMADDSLASLNKRLSMAAKDR